MTKTKRTILFLGCVFLFLASAPAVVFYYQGYRFDFSQRKVTQTGAFYFDILPKNASIYLDNKLKTKTDFLFGTTLIENLVPKMYQVRIEKDGYLPWEKTLEIKERQVTNAKNIVLIPQKINLSLLADKIDSFAVSPNNEIVALKTISPGLNVEIYDIKNNSLSPLIATSQFSPEDAATSNILFSPDSKNLLLTINQIGSFKYLAVDLDSGVIITSHQENQLIAKDTRVLPLRSLPNLAADLAFSPRNGKKALFLANTKLFELDLVKNETSQAVNESVLSYIVANKDIYYLRADGYIFKTDSSFLLTRKVSQLPFPLKTDAKYRLAVLADYVFAQENDALFLYNHKEEKFERFFENVSEKRISADLKKAAITSPLEVWIFFLEEKFDQPLKKPGEMTFLTRFSEKIGNLFWLSSRYLVFSSGNKIKIAETDERDHLNINDASFYLPTLAEAVSFDNPQLWFNQTDRKLYILDKNSFYVSEELIK